MKKMGSINKINLEVNAGYNKDKKGFFTKDSLVLIYPVNVS